MPQTQKQRLGPAFANVFAANATSSLGDGIAGTALMLLAARLTSDPLLISGLNAMAMLPWLLFAIPSGIMVDKYDRRRLLAIANTVRTSLAVVLLILVATGHISIWWLYGVLLVYGTFETLYDGSIRAVVPSIVARVNLPRANSLIEATELILQTFVSGPLTSVLFTISILIPFGLNVAAFGTAAILALFLPLAASGKQFHPAQAANDTDDTAPTPEKTDTANHEPWYRQFVDGFRFIISNKTLLTLWVFSTAGGIFFAMATSSLVLFVLHKLNLPEAAFGFWGITAALGGLLGTALAPRFKVRFGTGTTMAAGMILAGVAMLTMGLVPILAVAAVCMALSTCGIVIWNVLVMSLRQSYIPGRLLGRVHGTWRTLLWGAQPLGTLLGGLLGRVDLALPFIVSGIAVTALNLGFLRFLVSLPNPEDIDNGDAPIDAPEADRAAEEN